MEPARQKVEAGICRAIIDAAARYVAPSSGYLSSKPRSTTSECSISNRLNVPSGIGSDRMTVGLT